MWPTGHLDTVLSFYFSFLLSIRPLLILISSFFFLLEYLHHQGHKNIHCSSLEHPMHIIERDLSRKYRLCQRCKTVFFFLFILTHGFGTGVAIVACSLQAGVRVNVEDLVVRLITLMSSRLSRHCIGMTH